MNIYSNTKNPNSSVILFFVISLFYLIFNFIWWYCNTPILMNGISAVHFKDVFEPSLFYRNAPLLSWIMKTMFFIFGKDLFDLQIIFVNYVFFLVSLFFVYKLGLEIKDKETGNIAMLLFALTPAVYGLSRQYGHQDYHIISAITANIYCLIKSDYFKNIKWSVFYGITVGIGLLIKDEFIAYFFVPWLYTVIISLRENININKIVNVLITVTAGCVISGAHYFQHWIIVKLINEPFTETAPVFSFNSIKVVTISLWEDLLSVPVFILFVISLYYFLFRNKNKNKLIFIFWIFIPWFIVTFMPHHKKVEYLAGFIPSIILICSVYLANLSINIKKYIVWIILCICLVQYFIFSYSPDIPDLRAGKFQYYNIKNEDIMYYKKDNLLLELVDYIKLHYKNKSIFLLSYPQSYITEGSLSNILNLNDIKTDFYKPYYINKFEKTNSDIVVVFGDFSIDERVHKFYMFIKDHPYIHVEDFYKEEPQNLSKVTTYISQNYEFEKELFLNNIETKENKILFYKHK